MSLRIAVALAATLGVGMLMSTGTEARPDMVGFHGDYSPGTIVVRTNERRLYLVLDQEHAVRYPVGVGKAGKQWAGITQIDGKYRQPAWSPPADVKRDKPTIPDVIPGTEAVLIGKQGASSISANDLAAQIETISYEILAGIGPRVQRVYKDTD